MSGTSFSFPFSTPFGSGFSFVPGPGGSSLSSLNPTPPGAHPGGMDQLIDPVTLDYVRTANGEWAETSDNRTSMLIMLETEFGASPFDPEDGTVIKEVIRSGEPLSPEQLQAEMVRAGQLLAADGVISGHAVQVRDEDGEALTDERGGAVVIHRWNDLAAGSPINLVYRPTR